MGSGTLSIEALMDTSGVQFGTSGARGLVKAMTDEVCYAYAAAFLQYLRGLSEITTDTGIAVGGDLRASTDRIMMAIGKAIADRGHPVVNAGKLPTPALAFYGMFHSIPTLMVTGSHIPEDRNGIKFTRASGEITKSDEAAMITQPVFIPQGLFDGAGGLEVTYQLPAVSPEPAIQYVRRYVDFFGAGSLAGTRVGLYEHSTVACEPIDEILTALGAEVMRFGRASTFVPVDTEAIRPEDANLAKRWASEHRVDCIVSADGDGDRPLISDEKGSWLRGDIVGILCAAYLGADAVVTPVSSNTALERAHRFQITKRTRIGSPYVIAGMQAAVAEGARCVIGYEANGGVLVGSDIVRSQVKLKALPTRDAVVAMLSVLLLSTESRTPISRLITDLPQRFTVSDRLQAFPTEKSKEILSELYSDESARDIKAIDKVFAALAGKVAAIDVTDGLRMTFANEEIVHLRPSGNAPEFRCYTEAASPERAMELNQACMRILRGWQKSAQRVGN